MSSPQITAKMRFDARDVRAGTNQVQRQFSHLGKNIRREMTAALRGGLAVAGAAGTAAIGAAVGKGLRDGIAQSFSLESVGVILKSTLGDVNQVREAMAMLGEEAENNPMFSKKQLAEAAAGLSNYAKGSARELRELMHTAKLLSVLNPTQGLEGAAFALKEALGGDFVSLQSRFDISKAAVRDLKGQGLSGKELVDAVIRAQGITDQTLRDIAGTRQMQLRSLGNEITNIGEQFFDSIWPSLEPQLKGLQDWMKENGTEVVAGLKVIAQATGVTAVACMKLAAAANAPSKDFADYAYGNRDDLGSAEFLRYVPFAKDALVAAKIRRAWDKSVDANRTRDMIGSRTAEAVASGQVQPARAQSATALTINVTGLGITPQMSNS